MNRETFLASLIAIVTAPFTLKSKEKEVIKTINPLGPEGYYEGSKATTPPWRTVESQWDAPDQDVVTKEYVDNTYTPTEADRAKIVRYTHSPLRNPETGEILANQSRNNADYEIKEADLRKFFDGPDIDFNWK